MPKLTGHFVGMSTPRRMIDDFLRAGRQLPLTVIQRRMQLAPIVGARDSAQPRPSWCALFTKAFAAVTARHPELRRVYVSRPWPRFYQYDVNNFSIVIEREYENESALFLARIRSPEVLPIGELDALIKSYKSRPIEGISGFRSSLRLARFPRFIRSIAWAMMMNWCPRARGRQIGTHGVSVTGGMGAAGLFAIAPWPFTLLYDVLEPDGSLCVRITFDHRVVDGAIMAVALREIEEQLHGPILGELRSLRPAAAA
jgi:hypothetical protein